MFGIGLFKDSEISFESYDMQPSNRFFEGTELEMADINLEAAQDFSSILASLHVADVVLANAYVNESQSRWEMLTEATIGEIFEKIKNAILEFWNKVKTWFKTLLDKIKIFFSKASKLAANSEYVAQFRTNAAAIVAKGDTMSGYKIDIKKGDALAATWKKKVDDRYKAIETLLRDVSGKSFNEKVDEDVDDIKTNVFKIDGTVSEELRKAYGIDETQDIVYFKDGLTAEEILNNVKKDNVTTEVSKDQKEVDAKFKNIIQLVEKAKTQAATDEKTAEDAKAKLTARYTKAINVAKSYVALYNTICAARSTALKDIHKYCVKVFKKTITPSFKASKESYSHTPESFIRDFSI